MASITREQVNKINAKMGNGWELDVWYYLTHGEKAAKLEIPTEDGGYIKGTIYINSVWSWRPEDYKGIQIKINVSRWHKGSTDGVYTSYGLGWWEEINRPDMKKAMFSEVQKLTHEITAADILEMYQAHAGACANARIL